MDEATGDDRRRTALHEAGHCVAIWIAGGSICGPCSIRPRHHWRGIAHTHPRRSTFADIARWQPDEPPTLWPPRMRSEDEVHILSALAGPAAAAAHGPKKTGYVAARSDDDDIAEQAISDLLSRREEALLARGDDPKLGGHRHRRGTCVQHGAQGLAKRGRPSARVASL